MDWSNLRTALEELIDREFELAHGLSQALADENEALRQIDPAALDRATDAKQQSVTALSGLDSERRQFCVAYGLTPDREGMQALLLKADGDSGDLTKRWYSLLALLETCREANQRNGAVVSVQRRRVDDALGLLRGEAANAAIYDANGEIAGSDDPHVHTKT